MADRPQEDLRLADWDPTTAVEYHLRNRQGGVHRYVVAAGVTDNGTIRMVMTKNGYGTAYSLENLQMCEGVRVPIKAVPGWQAQLYNALGTGLYDVYKVV